MLAEENQTRLLLAPSVFLLFVSTQSSTTQSEYVEMEGNEETAGKHEKRVENG